MRTNVLRARILAAIGASSLAACGLSACGGDDNVSGTAGSAGLGAAGVSGMNGVGGSTGGSAGSMGSTGGSMSVAGAAGTSGSGGAAGSGGAMQDGSTGQFPDASDGAASKDAQVLSDAPSKDELPMTVRRPFLVGSSLRTAKVQMRDDWSVELSPIEDIDSRLAGALAASWLKDALEEHASIAAFARFTMLLLSVGAPPELVAGSQRASLDEIRHARACFALAARYGARAVGPGALRVADSLGALSLADLAALTVQEGCVGETLGALLAGEQLARASEPDVVRILRKIAADESRHAELSWQFVKWAVQIGGASVATRVREQLHHTIAEVENVVVRDYGVDLDSWHAHGRLSCVEARDVSRRGVRDVVIPCMGALLSPNVALSPAFGVGGFAGVAADGFRTLKS
jgi:hypothetical protein